MIKKTKVFIIDTSALLSGKSLHITDGIMVTTPGVCSEMKPGGRDHRAFQLLQEKGLSVESPSNESADFIKKTAKETGDIQRLSSADIEILSLSLDYIKNDMKQPIILTDDYSIQNIASILHLPFQNISQKKITKKFKWFCRCPGCGKQFTEPVKTCTICGTATKLVVRQQQELRRSRDTL